MVANRVYAEVVKLCMNMSIPQEFVRNMDIDSCYDHLSQEMAYRISLVLAGTQVCKSSKEIERHTLPAVTTTRDIPATWWDHFKLAVFKAKIPSWCDTPSFAKWRENATFSHVKYEKVTITNTTENVTNEVYKHYHVCPFPDKLANNNTYVAFMQWGEAYRGTADEYHALVRIAEAAKQGSGGYGLPNHELYMALGDYERAKAQSNSRSI